LPMLRPPTPTLFPYTTLFRSITCRKSCSHFPGKHKDGEVPRNNLTDDTDWFSARIGKHIFTTRIVNDFSSYFCGPACIITKMIRSEEHTSELQSRFDLVCRLL